MFTGIITDIGTVVSSVRSAGHDLQLAILAQQDLSDVAIGASIACSGTCLTVVSIEKDRFYVDLSAETVARTAESLWAEGSLLNLERALKVGDELGGHIVTGHVDGIGRIDLAETVDGSLHLAILAPKVLAGALAPKGSITVDGVSLTVNAVEDLPDACRFHLNIIPHTAQETTLGTATAGRQVNLEIDVLARYLARLAQVNSTS